MQKESDARFLLWRGGQRETEGDHNGANSTNGDSLRSIDSGKLLSCKLGRWGGHDLRLFVIKALKEISAETGVEVEGGGRCRRRDGTGRSARGSTPSHRSSGHFQHFAFEFLEFRTYLAIFFLRETCRSFRFSL